MTAPVPNVTRHQKVLRTSSRSAPTTSDPYHGNEAHAKLCAHFVFHLFACPEVPPAAAAPSSTPTPRLDHFIAYALHRTRLHPSVTFVALHLLQRLKARFPAAKGSSGHRLFITAFMIASKIICDDTYSNKSLCIVGQGVFALREINQMEREMCSYLEWQLNVEPKILKEFEDKVCRDFAGPGPYPPIVLPQPTRSPFTHPCSSSSTSLPSFGHCTSLPKPLHTDIAATHKMSSPSPSIPDTPSPSHSTFTSPASSASPPVPPESHAPYDRVRIVDASANSSMTSIIPSDATIADPVHHQHCYPSKPSKAPPTPETVPRSPASQQLSKTKAREGQFAFATRTVW